MRDTFGPLLTFYAGLKLVGLVAGVVAATVVAVAIVAHERGRGRPGAIARLALGLVFIRATAALLTGSPRVYLAQDVVIDVLLGSVFFVSLRMGKPITAVFAREIYPLPPEVTASETYAAAFRRITRVWVVYFFAVAAVRLAALLTLSVDEYVVVSGLTSAPLIILLLIWSVRHSVRSFRESAEWGPAIAALGDAAMAPARPARPSALP